MIEFTTNVSLGNLLTICLIIAGGARAWYALGSTSNKHTMQLEELTRRINLADLEKLKVCVDTMWLFQLRRGVSEVENKQLGTSNSPLKLTEQANALMAPILPDLKHFYEAIDGEKLDLLELAVEIERHFGAKLLSAVCKRIGVSSGACLILAIAQLRPIRSRDLAQKDNGDTIGEVLNDALVLARSNKLDKEAPGAQPLPAT